MADDMQINAEINNTEIIKKIPVVTTERIDGYKISGTRKLLSTTQSIGLKGSALITNYGSSIEQAKESAIKQLQIQAYENGFNAVVALKFDSIGLTVQGYVQYFISAYATGVKVIGKE